MNQSVPAQQRDLDGTLRSRSFVGLVLTQLLGAFNDNMFRWLVVPIGQAVPQLEDSEAISLGLFCFTLPYLLLAPAAGWVADRFSKQDVIVGCKIAEVVIMVLGVGAVLLGNIWLLFGVVTLMGAQSALFSPAKFGSLPELLSPENLSKGNGVMGLVTVVSSALGMVAGLSLYDARRLDLVAGVGLGQLWPAAAALLGVAVFGLAASLLIKRQPAGDPQAPPTLNPVTHTWPALQVLMRDKPLLRTALGISFFWFLASLATLNIDLLGSEVLGLSKTETSVLMVALVIGVALGSVLAGWWSGGRVELGLVPLGAMGIVVSSLCVYFAGANVVPSIPVSSQQGFYWSAVCLAMMGVSAGLFNVPLEAYLQHRSDVRTRGTILAGSNFLSFSFILLTSAIYPFLHDVCGLKPPAIFVVCGIGTIPVMFYAFRILPDITIRFLFWLGSHTMYRVKVIGADKIPEKGGALLVANHVSWVDGILLLANSSRLIRFLAYADYAAKPGLNWLSKVMQTIPIKASDGPKAIIRALKEAKERVAGGELVCIFAEGQLTRTGQLQPFQRGLLKIVQGTDVPVVPVHLYGLWGSIFSYRGGKFFWKKPQKWPYPVTIVFGEPISEPQNVHEVRTAVEQLGVEAVETEKTRQLIPARQFIRECKRSKGRGKVADSSGLELNGAKTLIGSLAFKRVLERDFLAADEQNVGLLVPPSVGGTLANMAVALLGRVAVNLNYTLTDETLNFCVQQAGIKHVLTSRKFLEKKPFALEGAEFVFLEDVKERVTGLDKAFGALATYAIPAAVLERRLGLHTIQPDDLCTIIFTSGSTGQPKGVMLSHHNVCSNIDAVDQLLTLSTSDVMLGTLPFFHCFGYTATMWLPLCFEPKAVFHFNPLDAKTVGKLSQKHKVTIILTTPTFLRTYMKRCTTEQFAALDLVVTGAEKMPVELAKQFEEKFGVLPIEGYGLTETSPVAAVNVPDHRCTDTDQKGTKLGTVGKVIPGCAARVVDPDTFEDRGVNAEGLLLIKGPNVMQGYLHQPEKTAEVLRDGWYNTGDFALIDDEGFVAITGRQSRFSKIGGEMVPHIRVEEELIRVVEELEAKQPVESETDDSQDETAELKLAVTSVPDERKGERLVVVHIPLHVSVEDVLRKLGECDLPNLFLPGADSFLQVDEIPLLGTGKLDLRGLHDLALAAFAKKDEDAA